MNIGLVLLETPLILSHIGANLAVLASRSEKNCCLLQLRVGENRHIFQPGMVAIN